VTALQPAREGAYTASNAESSVSGPSTRITRNGTQIWPSSGGAQALGGSDAAGHDTNVTLPVAAGDTLRSEVSDGGNGDATSDATAWAPSIAYQ
jgi:hypothetical protein